MTSFKVMIRNMCIQWWSSPVIYNSHYMSIYSCTKFLVLGDLGIICTGGPPVNNIDSTKASTAMAACTMHKIVHPIAERSYILKLKSTVSVPVAHSIRGDTYWSSNLRNRQKVWVE